MFLLIYDNKKHAHKRMFASGIHLTTLLLHLIAVKRGVGSNVG